LYRVIISLTEFKRSKAGDCFLMAWFVQRVGEVGGEGRGVGGKEERKMLERLWKIEDGSHTKIEIAVRFPSCRRSAYGWG